MLLCAIPYPGRDTLPSVFRDGRREPWAVAVLPALRTLAAQPGERATLADASGLKLRALRDVLSGRSRPSETVRVALAALVVGGMFSGNGVFLKFVDL